MSKEIKVIPKIVSVHCEFCGGSGFVERINIAWLKKQRKTAHVSLRQVAKKLKLSPAYISDIENGKRRGNDEIFAFYEALTPNTK